MPRTDLIHWQTLWRELGGVGEVSAWHTRLVKAYSEPLRRYHNLQHLAECLDELDLSRKLARRPALIEIALWFHDAVYDPPSTSNEEDSAVLAETCLKDRQVAHDQIETVRGLILSTKTHEVGADSDTALLIDIDLAILGKPAERFWAYERGIRAEYGWVPETTYRQKRAEILASFLARPMIYRVPSFRDRYEIPARANLSAAIARLKTVPVDD